MKLSESEFQQYWLSLAKRDAETDVYENEILKTTISIIEEKNYSHLFYLLKKYDKYVKMYQELKYGVKYKDDRYPFWCYCLGSTDVIIKDLPFEVDN